MRLQFSQGLLRFDQFTRPALLSCPGIIQSLFTRNGLDAWRFDYTRTTRFEVLDLLAKVSGAMKATGLVTNSDLWDDLATLDPPNL